MDINNTKVIERKNDLGRKDFFVKHKNCGWFHNCYACGSMIHFEHKHFLQIKGLFAGQNICNDCWKGNNES